MLRKEPFTHFPAPNNEDPLSFPFVISLRNCPSCVKLNSAKFRFAEIQAKELPFSLVEASSRRFDSRRKCDTLRDSFAPHSLHPSSIFVSQASAGGEMECTKQKHDGGSKYGLQLKISAPAAKTPQLKEPVLLSLDVTRSSLLRNILRDRPRRRNLLMRIVYSVCCMYKPSRG